jgi:hypothetical protein
LCSAGNDLGISLETALVTARQTLASVAERAKQPGYYSGARTDIINAHADLRAALDMLVKAAGPDGQDTSDHSAVLCDATFPGNSRQAESS